MADTRPRAGGPSQEEKIGSGKDSQRHPPHVTEEEKEGGGDEGRATDEGGPDLPATAHGEDKIPAEEQSAGVDPESMYDGRPEEDKDVSPKDQAEGRGKS